MNENNKNSNISQIALVGLLVVASFFIGILSSRVKQLEKTDVAQVPGESAQVAGAQVEELSFDEIATSLGLDLNEFNTCLASEDVAQRVEDELQSGIKAGVTGTPGNFLVDTQTNKVVVIAGALPIDMLEDSFTDLKAGNGVDNNVDPITESDYVQGDRRARYVLFEYSDYECPFCGSFHSTSKVFTESYDDIAWVYRQFPLDEGLQPLHPNTRKKSIAALCAGQIGGNDAFWAFSDALFGL